MLDNIILPKTQSTKLNEGGTTIMMVTHDTKVAAKCTRVMYIVDGNIKGEYKFESKANGGDLKEREKAINNWLMEMSW